MTEQENKQEAASAEAVEPKKKLYKSLAREIAYIALTVALITVCAWISIPVSEIAFTLQTFAVAIAGALMGFRRGTIAVVVYILMGLVGIPVFAGFKAGLSALLGATGGYIFGFLFLAMITGAIKHIPVKNKWARCGIFFAGMLVGLAVCYLFGTLWFAYLTKRTFLESTLLCVVPYLLFDCIKLALAAILTVRLEKYVK